MALVNNNMDMDNNTLAFDYYFDLLQLHIRQDRLILVVKQIHRV